MSNAPVVIYHADCLDGIGAAWCFWDYYDGKVDLIPATYGDEAPLTERIQDKKVYLVDFSYPVEQLEHLCHVAKSVTAIDHHDSMVRALASEPSLPDNLTMVLDVTKSGAVLAWQYLHTISLTPAILLHIQDRDLWEFKLPETKAICAALYSNLLTVEVLNTSIQDPMGTIALEAQGRILLRQEDRQVAKILANNGTTWELEDDVFIPAYNAPGFLVSEIGNTALKECPDAAYIAIYEKQKGRWKVSLRSRKEDKGINVAKIAEIYGGGGHPSAAGFHCATHTMLTFMLEVGN